MVGKEKKLKSHHSLSYLVGVIAGICKKNKTFIQPVFINSRNQKLPQKGCLFFDKDSVSHF